MEEHNDKSEYNDGDLSRTGSSLVLEINIPPEMIAVFVKIKKLI